MLALQIGCRGSERIRNFLAWWRTVSQTQGQDNLDGCLKFAAENSKQPMRDVKFREENDSVWSYSPPNRVPVGVVQPLKITLSLASRISIVEVAVNSSPLAASFKAILALCDPVKTPPAS